MPRPKGSKNYKTLQKEKEMLAEREINSVGSVADKIIQEQKKGRGRPKGSVNKKPKKEEPKELMTFEDVRTEKDLERYVQEQSTTSAFKDKQIKATIYNTLRERLCNENSGGIAFYQEFIENYLTEARRDPTSAPAQLLAKTIFKEDILNALDEQVESAYAREQDFLEYRLIKTMFDKQRDVFLDDFVRRKVIICSRRAGKTETVKRMLNKCCSKEKSPCCYINLTFENAINQVYDDTLKLADSIGLKVEKSSKSDGFILFANKSSITFRGNNSIAETEKLRGFKYRLVIVDEAQSQRNLKYLIDDVISPLLLDYTDSQLIVQGTPPRYSGSYFEEMYNQARSKKDPKMKAYNWSMLENPFLENIEEEIKNICARKGLTLESPLIQREYLGKIVYDTEAQVFYDYKTYQELVDFQPTHIAIGVDYGFADNNAIIALAYNVRQKKAYVIEERKFNKAPVSDIILQTREVYQNAITFGKAKNPNFKQNNVNIFCDTNEKSITFELSVTYGLPAYNAYKYDRDLALHTLADDCRLGMITVKHGGALEDEFGKILYKRNEDTDELTGEIDNNIYHPDATMALLYASRQFYFDIGSRVGGVANKSDFEKEQDDSGARYYQGPIASLQQEYNDRFTKEQDDNGVVWEEFET
jgi:hypothetical protein